MPKQSRNLSLMGVAFLVIGAITYVAVPAWSGTSANSANAGPAGQPTPPGPMPGAPTQQPTPGPTPSGGPQDLPHVTPKVLWPSNPTLVKLWNSGPGGNALAAVTALSSDALLANATEQYPALLLDCRALDTAVRRSLLAGLLPDTAMRAEYAAALGSFKRAAGSCAAGIRLVPDGVEHTVTKVNQAVMDRVASELSTGVSDLFAATEMLRQQ